MKVILTLIFALGVPASYGQWQVLSSHTTADLNGIYAVDNKVAWASGSKGTILRTEDGGESWTACVVPAGAADLDFRSIQALDEKTAVVMSSGKGKFSRVYKTTDACHTWKEVLENPGAAGSFVALRRATAYDMYLLGTPVDGRFVMFISRNGGESWTRSDDPGLATPKGASGFGAGNQALTSINSEIAFGSDGPNSSVYTLSPVCRPDGCNLGWLGRTTPLAQAGPNAGVHSIAGRITMVRGTAVVTGVGTMPATTLVVVGGDPDHPEENRATAAFSEDNGATWKLASTQPRGYRSGVDFDGDRDRFVAVGPNGTDVSLDDGLIWQALKPASGEPPDADQHWTAISVPFVVGPGGRIGRLAAAYANAQLQDNK